MNADFLDAAIAMALLSLGTCGIAASLAVGFKRLSRDPKLGARSASRNPPAQQRVPPGGERLQM